jgi:hypothetical protein
VIFANGVLDAVIATAGEESGFVCLGIREGDSEVELSALGSALG